MKKLNDNAMELVVGGIAFKEACAITALASLPVTVATSAAALGCYFQADKLRKNGDKVKAEKYNRATAGLAIASTAVAGVGTSALVTALV